MIQNKIKSNQKNEDQFWYNEQIQDTFQILQANAIPNERR
jgi:hypothetical protein